MCSVNYKGTLFHSSAFFVRVYYPTFKNGDDFIPTSLIRWQIIVDNCTGTRCMSVLNKKDKFIKFIIDDWSNVCKFIKRVEKLFPTSRIEVLNKIVPRFLFSNSK
jgi:hypothetical protein